MMIDRRGHRKLKLTSRKHFKPKRVRKSIAVKQSQEVQPPSLKISLPVTAYTNAPVSMINHLKAENISLQLNSDDCGVFVCLYSRCLAERSAFNFTQTDVID